jgi:crotonobetainyl-CoA:carnitine CoA-transferase CaiB-like acyl-CoA transferase
VLTQAWAGTYATELLALLGADVIQLEVRSRLDSWRGTYRNPIPKNLTDRAEAKHAWNLSPLYNSVNLGKRCITLDLATTEGVDVFKRLVAHADFVAENFSPRVMANFGLDYARLRGIRPDLVMASLSAYGATGPWAHVPGIGGTIEPSSGMSSLLGYPGEHPQNSGQMYPDPVAGLCGFAAIALALLHRDSTGEGQFIDLSMQEANFTFIGDAWLEFAINRTVRGPMGNRHPLYTPHGIFPAQGEDQWIAIAAETDAQWRALCIEFDLDASRWPTAAARKADEAAIEAQIAERTARYDKMALSAALAARGVTSAPVLDAREVAEDETLRRRGHVVRVEHPEAGPMWQSALPAKLSRTPIGAIRPAPLQGEHSFEVFRSLIGMRVAEYDALVAAEVSGSGPTARHETSQS